MSMSASYVVSSQEPSRPQTLARPAERLLLVEDDHEFREIVARVLTQAGYNVESHADGQTALARAEVEDYDLILSDVMLPGVDGWRLVKSLRECGRAAPVVLMSGESSLATSMEAEQHDVARYLIKPFRLDVLLRVIDETIFGHGSDADPR